MEDLAQTVRVSIPLKSGLNCRHNLRSILHGELCLNPFEIRAELPREETQVRIAREVSIPLKSGLNCRNFT